MRKISAHFIFPVSQPPIKNGILILDDENKISDLIDPKNTNIDSIANLEFYNGIIVPGFVNTHCHLELSYLKNLVPVNLKLHGFIEFLVNNRNTGIEKAESCINLALNELKKNGIVAIGDISNTNITFSCKTNSSIYFHTFIECFGINPSDANKRFNNSVNLLNELQKQNLNGSLVPHAPYSLSKKLFNLIFEINSNNKNAIVSIHNQEGEEENNLFKTKSGAIYNALIKIGANKSYYTITDKNSLESIIQYLPSKINTILVHNTFSNFEDFNIAENYFENLFWCICPNSNLYIENALPDITLMNNICKNITIGTDSLASNRELSILSEIITISKNFPEIKFETILKWATLNGSFALNIDNKFGSFDVGKKPGVNLIQNFDFDKMTVSENSSIKVLA
ncbi:MAG: hypothetical protein A2046_02570 [Bacteroidetes bacterium GWA2_30_7]|nr:MAG: hypothetical protein A2046_02570 [Bacteroidetes bacterium GWA2_30_7]